MILFTADWCPHCQKVKQFLAANPSIPTDTFGYHSSPSDAQVDICDVDKDFETPLHYGVKQMPALLRIDGELMVESLDIIEYIKEDHL